MLSKIFATFFLAGTFTRPEPEGSVEEGEAVTEEVEEEGTWGGEGGGTDRRTGRGVGAM